MIKYNQLYQSLKKVSADWHAGHLEWYYTWNYLKFFSDGTFISASIAGENANVINEAFVKGAKNIADGKYSLEKNYLLKLSFGDVVVNGVLNNDGSIVLEGKISWDIFVPID